MVICEKGNGRLEKRIKIIENSKMGGHARKQHLEPHASTRIGTCPPRAEPTPDHAGTSWCGSAGPVPRPRQDGAS